MNVSTKEIIDFMTRVYLLAPHVIAVVMALTRGNIIGRRLRVFVISELLPIAFKYGGLIIGEFAGWKTSSFWGQWVGVAVALIYCLFILRPKEKNAETE